MARYRVDLIPIAVVDRVGPSLYATGGTAARRSSRFRIREQAAKSCPPPAARLGVPAWAEIAALLHRAAGGTPPHVIR